MVAGPRCVQRRREGRRERGPIVGERPFALLSQHHQAFDEYRRALVAGALGELIQREEVAGHPVRPWSGAHGPPEVVVVLYSLARGDAHLVELVSRESPASDAGPGGVLGWESETGALVAAPGYVAVWWYREWREGDALPCRTIPNLVDECVVVGLRGEENLWRVGRRRPLGDRPVSGARALALRRCGRTRSRIPDRARPGNRRAPQPSATKGRTDGGWRPGRLLSEPEACT